MGTWGPGIFSDDVASDARERYREFLEDGLDDAAALASLINEMALLDGGQLSGNTRIAIALTLHRFGRLTNEARDDALAVIDAGPEAHWDTAAQVRSRTAALANARNDSWFPISRPVNVYRSRGAHRPRSFRGMCSVCATRAG